MARKKFSFRERLEHYSGVASGKVSTKSDSKFSDSEQRAYARGQRDARNEARRFFAWKNSTDAQREAYKSSRKEKREAYDVSRKKKSIPTE